MGDRSEDDVLVGDRAVVALQQDGSGLAFVGIQCPTGDPRDLLMIDDAFSVELHRHPSAQKSDVEDLPFAHRLGSIFRRRDAAVQPP